MDKYPLQFPGKTSSNLLEFKDKKTALPLEKPFLVVNQ